MNLHFITSLNREYWELVGQYCIPTWNLPGRVTIYVEQTEGDIKWVKNIPFDVEILIVPQLINTVHKDRKKVLKFWGKSYAQIHAVKNRGIDERVVWIDADVEQLKNIDANNFTMELKEPFAIMNSGDHEDCWESGLVIFNQQCDKLGRAIKRYEASWLDEETLDSLWRPYDAQVLGYVAGSTGFHNLCLNSCSNADAFNNSRYAEYFKHWINKENKALLREISIYKNYEENSSNISSVSAEYEEPGEN
jgi:hypothetical protein